MTPKQKLARLLWLAFNASSPMGMGFLHTAAASAQTEASLIESVGVREKADGSLEAYTDYLFGRMMKTGFSVTKDGVLSVSPEVPRRDYQSWAGRFSSGSNMVAATEKDLALVPSPVKA